MAKKPPPDFWSWALRHLSQADFCWVWEHFDAEWAEVYEQIKEMEIWTVAEMLASPVSKTIIAHFERKWAERTESRELGALRRKTTNAAEYADKINVLATMRERGQAAGTVKSVFDKGLDCPGLMARYLQHAGVDAGQPVVMNLLNRLPLDEQGRQLQVPEEEAGFWFVLGYLLAGTDTLWNRNIAQLWQVMHRCLPQAIDFASYHRRLRAPLVPGGYMPGLRVRFCELRSYRLQLVDGVEWGPSLRADGSGLYDPHHPEMQGLVERYGRIAFQYSAFQPETGHLMKGVLYPREGLNRDVAPEHQAPVWFDHLQAKGAKKAEHKLLLAADPMAPCMLDGVHLGIMKAKRSWGRVGWCFETIENVGPNPAYYNKSEYKELREDTARILSELTREDVDLVGEQGVWALVAQATKSDPSLRRLVEFLVFAQDQGADINPLSIPSIQSRVQESLSRRLWQPTNGAGVSGKYPLVLIDATLEPGTCVVSCYDPGTKVACWRYPTILPQSLLVLRVVGAQAHHKVQGRTTPFVIFMHPRDITVRQQGDDDGDEVGISDDPRLIALFERRADRNVYHIEPTGEKMNMATDSDGGRAYIQRDNMGPTGLVTIWRSALLAVGDHGMALAFAVLIQEAIDSEKRRVRMTCPLKASHLKNWYCDRNGEYHVHYRCDGGECLCAERLDGACPNEDVGYLTSNWHSDRVGFDIEVVREVYERAVMAAGCFRWIKDLRGNWAKKPGWPLGWRTQNQLQADGSLKKLRKAVALGNWKSWQEKQPESWQRGNWVHYCHAIARPAWERWEQSFESESKMLPAEVLPRILQDIGLQLEPLDLPWSEYHKGLRARSGLIAYGKAMGKVMANHDEETRVAAIDQHRAELEGELQKLTSQEILEIWHKELTPCWWYRGEHGRVFLLDQNQVPENAKAWQANRPNYALHALCNKRSQLMADLGATSTEACPYMDDKLVSAAVKWIRDPRQPAGTFRALSAYIEGNSGHAAAHVDEDGEPQHLVDCESCCQALKAGLVRSIRLDKTAKETREAKRIISLVNKSERTVVKGWVPKTKTESAVLLAEDPWA